MRVIPFSWAVIVSFLPLLTSCAPGSPPPEQSGPPPTPVKLDTVQKGTVADDSDYVGSLQSRQVATLRSQVSGQVSRIEVQSGQTVNPGTLLLQVDPLQQQAVVGSRQADISAQKAGLASAQALLQSYEAEFVNRKAQVDYDRAQVQRNQDLFTEGAISRDLLDQNQRDLRQSVANLASMEATINAQKAAIAQAQGDVLQAQADTQAAQVQLRYYQIRAPWKGRLGDIQVRVGDYVTPQSEISTIRQEDVLDLVVAIPLDRAPLVRIGLPIDLLNSQGQPIGSATVDFIDPLAQSTSQSLIVKARLDNRDGLLRADQFVRTRIVWSEQPGLLIPVEAISRIAGQSFVFVAQSTPDKGLQALQKPVQLGGIQGNQVAVLQGLEPNQQIVVSGIQKIFDQAPIMNEADLPKPSPSPQ